MFFKKRGQLKSKKSQNKNKKYTTDTTNVETTNVETTNVVEELGYKFKSAHEIKLNRVETIRKKEQENAKIKKLLNRWFESEKRKVINYIGDEINTKLLGNDKNTFYYSVWYGVKKYCIYEMSNYAHMNDLIEYDNIYELDFANSMSICVGNILKQSLIDAGGYHKVTLDAEHKCLHYLSMQIEE